METSIKLFEDLLESQEYELSVSYMLLSDQGIVLYSQNEKDFPIGSAIDITKLDLAGKSDRIHDQYYVFAEKGSQGWYLLTAVNKDSYSYDIRKWIAKFALFALLSIMISLLLGLYMWKIVYRPIKTLNKEIDLLAQSKFNSVKKMTRIMEFDRLLHHFYNMKEAISQLFRELEEKERKKRLVEVEKLLHQINPHFLHNTLNTVQWLARMNGQHEIDRLVALFTRVLHYNLGKEGGIVTLEEEASVLQDYVDLQRIRYAYNFEVTISIDPDLFDVQVPRFIMQPIVENAIYHGLKDESGAIRIHVGRDGGFLVITVQDNGEGMTDDEIAKLLEERSDEHRKVGLGIGLSYVRRMLEVYCGDRASMEIVGVKGKGTTFKLRLPITRLEPEEDL
jgi:two-component system sensor histidine kinase YesM